IFQELMPAIVGAASNIASSTATPLPARMFRSGEAIASSLTLLGSVNNQMDDRPHLCGPQSHCSTRQLLAASHTRLIGGACGLRPFSICRLPNARSPHAPPISRVYDA